MAYNPPLPAGQATMSNSSPVVIASDQSAIPISGTITATPTGTQDVNLIKVGGTNISIGQQLAAASLPVILPTATITTLTPPAAITGFNLEATQLLVKANTDNLDVALSTRLKPADTLAGVTLIGTLTSITNPVAVTGTFWQATQPISGTVTANAGTNLNTSLLALDSTVAKDTSLTTLNTSVNTLLKPASTLAALTSITNVVHVDDNAGSITVDGTFWQATQPISASSLPLPTLASTSTKQSDGSQKTQIVDGSGNVISATSNALDINIKSGNLTTLPVTNAGTFAVQSDLVKVGGTNVVNGGLAGSQSIGGTVATNVAITDNPINLGAQAVSSENSAITTARKAQLVSDLVGKLIVLPYANPENFIVGVTAAITDTTSTSTIAAQGSGIRSYITSILVTNSHATVSTFVKILDGSTIIWEGYALAAGGGFSQSFPVPLRGTANTAVNTQCVTTGANIICSIAGYKGV